MSQQEARPRAQKAPMPSSSGASEAPAKKKRVRRKLAGFTVNVGSYIIAMAHKMYSPKYNRPASLTVGAVRVLEDLCNELLEKFTIDAALLTARNKRNYIGPSEMFGAQGLNVYHQELQSTMKREAMLAWERYQHSYATKGGAAAAKTSGGVPAKVTAPASTGGAAKKVKVPLKK